MGNSQELDDLRRKNQQLREQVKSMRQEIERLRQQLEEALRAAKRQAGPFARPGPKANPAQPGRKRGARYGRVSCRPIPTQVDETLEAPLPPQCPHCQGRVVETGVQDQYQTEIPQPRVERIRFRVHVGECQSCGRRVQGRHARQTSDALGRAASQLGPRAMALAAELNKGLGLSYGKTAMVLQEAFGLAVSRGGLSQVLACLASKAEPTYQELVQVIRGSGAVTPDETGWRVGGQSQWLWVFASEEATVYSIQPGRGFEQAALILGADFAGFLTHDGWRVYDKFGQAFHQACVGHLLHRCRQLIEIASPAAARFPRAVRGVLQQALELRDRRQAGHLSEQGLAVARGRLEAHLDRLLESHYHAAANQRFAKHLHRNREFLFTFLTCAGLEATNWRAEQALRPAVVNRKVWGGNRTWRGAHTQEILNSVRQTCRQQKRSWLTPLIAMLCSPLRKVWNLFASGLSPPIPQPC